MLSLGVQPARHTVEVTNLPLILIHLMLIGHMGLAMNHQYPPNYA